MPRPTNAELDRWKALEAEGLAECRRCGETKPLDRFGFNRGKRRRVCKPCTNAQMGGYAKRKYAQDPEAARALHRERTERWRERNPAGYKAHTRNSNLKRMYGITASEFDALLAAQGGVCAICGGREPRGKNWHLDHCHESRAIRGVLCHPCNLALGYLQDQPERAEAAAAYLRRC